ncbi:hypothetical protein AUJ68_02595 [Candidatus Woesearchaeota archaeon CG1_02_57_44]|nr:MAG: hypothetical protein AUJ68_02595 [Candidatus Woesearchaeota archaeon CG1_02_57_44]
MDTIAVMTIADEGAKALLQARIIDVRRFKGFVVLHVTDGTGSISAVVRGLKADVSPGQAVRLEGTIGNRDGVLELQVYSFLPLQGVDADVLLSLVQERLDALGPAQDGASWLLPGEQGLCDALSRMPFAQASRLLLLALVEQSLIHISHHADADGYCAGLAIERALLARAQGTGAARKIRRTACKSPVYGYAEALGDIDSTGKGLYVILDNGGTAQDIGIAKLKAEGCKVLIVDHHPPRLPDNDALASQHPARIADCCINPHLIGQRHTVGQQRSAEKHEAISSGRTGESRGAVATAAVPSAWNPSAFSAGMLSAELAASVLGSPGAMPCLPVLAAVSGLADKASGDMIGAYVRHVDALGYSRALLDDMILATDYETWLLRPTSRAESLWAMLCAQPEEAQRRANLAMAEAKPLREAALACALHTVKVTHAGSGDDGQGVGQGSGAVVSAGAAKAWLPLVSRGYPSPGKLTGMVHRELEKQHPSLLTIGMADGFVVLRSTGGHDVNAMVKALRSLLPWAMIDGGGHALAGAIRFSPLARKEVFAFLEQL